MSIADTLKSLSPEKRQEAARDYRHHARGWTPNRPPRLSLDRIIRFVLGAAAVALVLWLLWVFALLVAYLAIGLLIAYLLRPLVDRLQSLGINRVWAILVTMVGVFGLMGIFLSNILPFIVAQGSELSEMITMARVLELTASVEMQIRQVVPLQEGFLIEGVSQAIQTLFQDAQITSTVGSVMGLASNIFYAVLVIPFVTFFTLKDGTYLRHALLQPVPNKYFEPVLALMSKVEKYLGRYFRALILQAIAIATIATVLLYFAGLNYALAVGIFTGIANTIPYLGPALGFLVGTIVGIAQTGDLSLVFGILVAMALTQIADNTLVYPVIYARATRAHPLVILFVVLVAAQLAGIVGMLLAVPVMTIARVTIEQILWSLRNYRILQT